MKILIATGLYPPEIGGPATYTKLLEEELPKHGFSVDVLPFREVRKYPKVLRHILYFLKALVRAAHADIVYAQDPVSVGLPALLAAKLTRTPFTIRVAGDYAWEQAVQRFGVADSIDEFQRKHYSIRVGVLRSIEYFVVCRAALVVTPSEYFRNLVSGWTHGDVRTVKIYNGIALPESAHTKPEANTIISAGRLVPWKGFDALIELLAEMPEWKLRIVGDGPDRARLEQTAEANGVENRVHFPGSIPRESLLRELHRASVFVLNSSFESFSFQLVEAMAVGTPVVAADIGDISEIITSGENGILVPLNDQVALRTSIEGIAADDALRERLTQNGRKRAEDFSVSRTAEHLVREFNLL